MTRVDGRNFRQVVAPISQRSNLALAILLLVAVLIPSAGRATTVHANGDYADIGGNPVRLHVVFPNKDDADYRMVEAGPEAWPDKTILSNAGVVRTLKTPLDQQFDTAWSVTTDSDGKTLRDSACEKATDAIVRKVADKLERKAHDLSCSFASTGTLKARATLIDLWNDTAVDAPDERHQIEFSYVLSDNTIRFRVSSGSCIPDSFDLASVVTNCTGVANPEFKVTFDNEVLVSLSPGQRVSEPCAFTIGTGTVLTHNASANPTNLTGDLVWAAEKLTGGLGDLEDELNKEKKTLDLGLSQYLAPIQNGCNSAAKLGFTRVDTCVCDPHAPGDTISEDHPGPAGGVAATVQFIHPSADPLAVIEDDAARPGGVANLGLPTIGTTSTRVTAGSQLGVFGNGFAGYAGTQLGISWSGWPDWADHFEVMWGLEGAQDGCAPGGQMWCETRPKPVLSYNAADSHPPVFSPPNLAPRKTYQFRVRACDQITCSRWSDWVVLVTTPAGSDQVKIYLDNKTQSSVIGSGTRQKDGTFSATLTIPPTTSAGKHTVYAVTDMTGPRIAGDTSVIGKQARELQPSNSGGNSNRFGQLGVGGLNLVQDGSDGCAAGGAVPNTALRGEGKEATTFIVVLGAGDTPQPCIEPVDSNNGTSVADNLYEGHDFTLRGEGFTAGNVSVFLDRPTGQSLGTSLAGSDGAFSVTLKMPSSMYGQHKLVALETVNGRTFQASVSITVKWLR